MTAHRPRPRSLPAARGTGPAVELTAAPSRLPRRRCRDSNLGRTTRQASSKETSWRRSTGKARKTKVPSATRRLRLGLGLMLTLLLVVGGKLFLVQGLDVGGMAEAALNNRLTPMELPAERGSILDSNGTVLASSVIRYNVVVDQTVNTKTESFQRLEHGGRQGQLVKVSRDQGIDGARGRPRHGPQTTSRTRSPAPSATTSWPRTSSPTSRTGSPSCRSPGIVTEGTSKRVYPNGSVAGGIVGFLKDGTTGQAGLEQTQDEVLKGTPGKRLFEIGADGLRIPVGVDQLTPGRERQGRQAHAELGPAVLRPAGHPEPEGQARAPSGASSSSSDVKTGNIIAMADTNAPDPNDPGQVAAKDRGVRAVTAAYEPGSVEKMITAAAAHRGGQVPPAGHLHRSRHVHGGRPDLHRRFRRTAPRNAPSPASLATP